MKLTPASSARWMMRMDSSWSLLPQSPNIMAPRQSGLTYMPVRPRVRCSIAETLLPAGAPRGSARRGGGRGGDADGVVAAGGEVAGDGQLLGRAVGDPQLAVGAAGGADGRGGGVDRGRVAAGGFVDHDHEPLGTRLLAFGLEHEPGHEQRQHHEGEGGEK